MGENEPHGVVSLGHWGMVGRVYVGNTKHCNILNILAEGLMGSKKIF